MVGDVMRAALSTKFKISNSYQNQYKIKTIKLGSSSIAVLSLAACGGDGGGGNATPAPPPTPPPVPTASLSGFSETSAFVYVSAGGTYASFSFTDTDVDLTVTGGAGADSIEVGRGNDLVNAGEGNDSVQGLLGADVLDGGAGYDILIYGTITGVTSTEGVNINLVSNSASGGDAQGDQFSNFEAVFGSNYNDILTGDNNGNILSGRIGNDTISGGGGNDYIMGGSGANILDGGDGYDLVVYGSFGFTVGSTIVYFDHFADVPSVNVNLQTQTAVHAGTTDQIMNFEGVIGSSGDDILTGSTNGENHLRGNLGDDIITGGDDDDSLYGDTNNIFSHDGDDIINGGGGDDYIDGSGGNDTLIGGSGADVIYPGPGTDVVIGGDGDDVFVVYGDNNNSILEDQFDGGNGDDAFLRGNANYSGQFEIDLSLMNATNMEHLSLGPGTNINVVTLTVQDVIDMTDADNLFQISGGVEDSVTSIGEGWVQGADFVIDINLTYHTYLAGGATLYIEDDVTQTIS
tara:strand:- start:67967 stop:69517 length:1551 start_codon:yes stop_codon:yes gene_type:complete